MHKAMAAATLAAALAVSFVLGVLDSYRITRGAMLTGRQSAEEYLLSCSRGRPLELGAYPLYQWLNHNSGPKNKAILLGPTSFFYLQREAVASSFADWNPLVVLFNRDKSPREICQLSNQDGVRYLVFQPPEFWRLSIQYPANRLTPAGKARMDDFFQSGCIEKIMSVQDDQILLYRILPRTNERPTNGQ